MAIVDKAGTFTAVHELPANVVLPPHGAGAEAWTAAVTPAALVTTTSPAATEARSARIRTEDPSVSG
jgi:hypothetical protein